MEKSEIAAIVHWLGNAINLPATVLFALFLLGVYVLWQAQKNRSDFDIADMLKDENGKASGIRFGIFVSLAISSWSIITLTLQNKNGIEPTYFVWYLLIWSGAKVAESGIKAWSQSKMAQSGASILTGGASDSGGNPNPVVVGDPNSQHPDSVRITSQSTEAKGTMTITAPAPPAAEKPAGTDLPDEDPTEGQAELEAAVVSSKDKPTTSVNTVDATTKATKPKKK